MPFTVTHMLATVPASYVRTPAGIFTALTVGSMIPDWPLFLPFGPGYETTHSFTGLFTACLPLGLAVTLLFILLMKRPFHELLPRGMQRRTARYLDQPESINARTVLQLALAVILGALTHIVWDAFTHGDAWGVRMFPELRQVWVSVAGVRFTGYLALQHGSSLVGLPLLLVLFVVWFVRAPVSEPPACSLSPVARFVWLAVIIGIPLFILVKYQLQLQGGGIRPIMRALYFGITEGGFAFLVLTAGYTLVFFPLLQARKQAAARKQ